MFLFLVHTIPQTSEHENESQYNPYTYNGAGGYVNGVNPLQGFGRE